MLKAKWMDEKFEKCFKNFEPVANMKILKKFKNKKILYKKHLYDEDLNSCHTTRKRNTFMSRFASRICK